VELCDELKPLSLVPNALIPPPKLRTNGLFGAKALGLFIQMELCNVTLHEWIEERNKNLGPKLVLNMDDVLDCLFDVLGGLSVIHSSNYIHRDIKPRNILYKIDPKTGKGVWKIGDFGLATTATTLFSTLSETFEDKNVKERTKEIGVKVF
jgi:eukaryotic translation initiation factor 2-alpha kinase 1